MRYVAGGDYDEAQRIARWPVREVLLAYLEAAREYMRADYRQAMLIWAALAPHLEKRQLPPKKPPLLEEPDK